MGKKNKQKHQTAQNTLPDPSFANSKVIKNNNKMFDSKKKKNLVAKQVSENIDAIAKPLQNSPNSFQISSKTQNAKGSKKSKNKQDKNNQQINVQQQNDTVQSVSSKKKKKNKKNKALEKQAADNDLESPNDKLHMSKNESINNQPLSKSAKRKLKKQLKNENKASPTSQKEDKSIENYIPLSSPAKKSLGGFNGSNKNPGGKNFSKKKLGTNPNAQKNSPPKVFKPQKGSPVKNRAVLETDNAQKTKSIYSSSSGDDELDFDTTDEEDDLDDKNRVKTAVTDVKKNIEQQFVKSTLGTLKRSESDLENDEEEDEDEEEEEDSSEDENVSKQDSSVLLNKKNNKSSFTTSHESSDDDDDDEGDDSEEDEEIDSEEDETEEKVNNIMLKKSKTDAQSNQRKRKSDSTQSSPTKKEKFETAASKDDLDGDSSEEENTKGKDFIDSEAEEGEETNEDELEDSENEEDVPPTKKSKFSAKEDGDNEDENKVFINNLPANTTEGDLEKILSTAGNVSSIVLPRSRENNEECRGFAFVTLPDKETLNKVLELDHVADLNGQTINIRIYNSEGRGGGRGRGQGFRGSQGGRGFRGGRGGGGGFRGRGGGGFRGSFDNRNGGFRGSRGGGFRGSPGGRGGGGFRGSPGGRGGGGFRGSPGGRGGGGFRGSPGGRGRGFNKSE